MKNYFNVVLSVLLIAVVGILSCEKKNSNNEPSNTTTSSSTSGTTGGTTGSTTGTTSTTTGTTTTTGTSTTNLATQNSTIDIGNGGWTFAPSSVVGTCTLSGHLNGSSTAARLIFNGTPVAGNYYYFSPTGLPRMEIYDAPGQPSGVTWYSKSGSVYVSTATSTSYYVYFSWVQCTQQAFTTPSVTASGYFISN